MQLPRAAYMQEIEPAASETHWNALLVQLVESERDLTGRSGGILHSHHYADKQEVDVNAQHAQDPSRTPTSLQMN